MALPGNFRQRPNVEPLQTGNDRVINLKKMEGLKPKDSIGLVDKRIFEGTNKLHAIYDEQLQLWYLKYDQGSIPQALDMKYTSYSTLIKHARTYFANRNIELIDA